MHAAVGFAKHSRRHATLAVTASIGPGAMNLVTGAALATVNRLPVFLLPGDTYATRHQGPVLQQLQHPVDADLTVNDVFRPISRFFDRITRPEQLLTALPAAIRTLVDPVETGAVVLSLPQDVQSHAYDFPADFFAERDWVIRRPAPDADEIAAVAELLASAKKPIIIAGGGVIYSERHRRARAARRRDRRAGRRDLRRQGRCTAGCVVAGRRYRTGRHPGHQHPGQRGRRGAHRRVPADRLRHRIAFHLRQPRCAVRQHQCQRPRRGPAGRHRHRRRREARPGRADRSASPSATGAGRPVLAGPGRGTRRRLGHRAGGCVESGPVVRQVLRCQRIPTS